jgi:hypothetical protein
MPQCSVVGFDRQRWPVRDQCAGPLGSACSSTIARLIRSHGWFTEGFDTPDLKEAKVLLDELA